MIFRSEYKIWLFNILIVCTAGGDGGAPDNAPYKVGPPPQHSPSIKKNSYFEKRTFKNGQIKIFITPMVC